MPATTFPTIAQREDYCRQLREELEVSDPATVQDINTELQREQQELSSLKALPSTVQDYLATCFQRAAYEDTVTAWVSEALHLAELLVISTSGDVADKTKAQFACLKTEFTKAIERDGRC